MTIMYTIGIVLMSLAFAIAFYNILLMAEGKRKVWMLPILVVVGTMLILVTTSTPRLDKYYEVDNPHSYQDIFPDAYEEGYEDAYGDAYEEGYGEGYHEAIKDAILIEDNKHYYVISFNGVEHMYLH